MLVDETHSGHHRIYSEYTVSALSAALKDRADVVYAIPLPIPNVNARHVPTTTPEPKFIRLLRRMERATGYPVCRQAKWRWLSSLAIREQIDAMLLLDGDSYLHQRGGVPSLPCRWIPLVMHPRFLRLPSQPDTSRYLRSENVPFVYVLDEGVRAGLERHIDKPVYKFPDLSNAAVACRPDWASEIERRRRDRKVVGVFGAVNAHKNIGGVLAVASVRQDLFFVIAGIPFLHKLSPAERQAVRSAMTSQNIFWILQEVPDAELNYLHTLSDILFAAYLQFPHSANRLTKSADFGKPVVVSQGFYMEEVVNNYGLGVSCDPTSVASMSAACTAASSFVQSQSGRTAYLCLNDPEALHRALDPLAELMLPQKAIP